MGKLYIFCCCCFIYRYIFCFEKKKKDLNKEKEFRNIFGPPNHDQGRAWDTEKILGQQAARQTAP